MVDYYEKYILNKVLHNKVLVVTFLWNLRALLETGTNQWTVDIIENGNSFVLFNYISIFYSVNIVYVMYMHFIYNFFIPGSDVCLRVSFTTF